MTRNIKSQVRSGLEDRSRYITDAKLSEICKTIGVVDSDNRNQLKEALVNHACFDAMSQDRYQGTLPADVRRELEGLARLLHPLAERFERMSDMTRDSLLVNSGKLAEVQGEEWFGSVYDFPEDLRVEEKPSSLAE